MYHYGGTYGLKEHKKCYGSGENMLRTSYAAQPGALKYGDILLTGEKVVLVSAGYNGIVIVEVEDEHCGKLWRAKIELPSRIPVAIKRKKK